MHSCVLVLHRRAWGKANKGHYRSDSPLGQCQIAFTYEVIKVWELSPERLLNAGPGLLPLLPLSAISKAQLRPAVAKMAKRLRQEVPRAIEADIWCATYVMLGLRYDEHFAATLLQRVRNIMRESTTYQSIIEEGLAEGRHRGLLEGRNQGLLEGRQEGKIEGRRDAILLLGTERFGRPTERVQKKLTAIQDPQQLDVLTTRLMRVSSWQELLAANSN